MEVKIDKRYPIRASVEQCWAVLSDIRATGACLPGAQITEQLDKHRYKGIVKAKVGPASMQFLGEIEVLAMDANARSLQMLGKGADRGGSSASMKLAAHVEPGGGPDTAVLVGETTVTVSGKLAQFGSRLLVPVSDAMLAQFADNFRSAAAAMPATPPVSTLTNTSPVSTWAAGLDSGPEVASTPTAVASPSTTPSQIKELNALSLLWTVMMAWFAKLFGRRA